MVGVGLGRFSGPCWLMEEVFNTSDVRLRRVGVSDEDLLWLILFYASQSNDDRFRWLVGVAKRFRLVVLEFVDCG